MATIAAALSLGAAAFSSPPRANACSLVALTPSVMAVEAEVVVVARVERSDIDGEAVLSPEAFLKGAVSSARITVSGSDEACSPAALPAQSRVLVFFYPADRLSAWPNATQVFELRDGAASRPIPGETYTEAGLIAEVRHLTGQYALPAVTPSEGAGIDWFKTVVPVGAALAVIMAVSLWLMRIWHRIDPS